MNFYLLDVHINFCYTYESSRYDLVQFGPLNMISQQMLSRISAILQRISSEDVPFAWWTEFSTWQDFQALLCTRTLLSIHRVVQNIQTSFENINECDATLAMIDDNGNMEIMITLDTEDTFNGFKIKAKRKRIRRLKDIAAFNVAKHLASESDVESLFIPKTLKPIVNKYIITYSGNYFIDMNSKSLKNRRILDI